MKFYKVGDRMWEIGSPVMIILFIEDVEQEFLDGVKKALSGIDIEPETIQTIFFPKLKFGAVLIEEGRYFNERYWDHPPDDITEMEDKTMGVLFEELAGKRWDGLWYKHLISEDLASLEVEFDGLADHELGYAANASDFGFVSTKENVEEPIMFFKTILDTEEEPETELVLNDAVEPPESD